MPAAPAPNRPPRTVSVGSGTVVRVLGLTMAVVALLVAGTVGAGAAGAQSDDTEQTGQRLPTRGAVGTARGNSTAEPLDLVGGLLRGVPIIDGDFADPYALSERDAVYIYATNTTSANIPVLKLPKGDAITADYLGDALPTLPSWTTKGMQWAPSVWARPDGTFVMYYVTPAGGGSTKQCISRATASSPAGPFTDDSTSAFICPLSQGGAIDPSVFVDDGKLYLLWKSDGNCCNLPTDIYSQEMSKDGTSVAGAPTKLIDATQIWEKDLVEGPSMIRQGDRYFLFYSANDWNTVDYAIGAATCESITGPCKKTIDEPWMRSMAFSKGPGGQEFFTASTGRGIWMVHHGWLPGQAGTPDGQRRLYLNNISLESDGALPRRSDTAAVEKALLSDAAVLALVGGLVVGTIVVGVGWFRRRRGAAVAGGVESDSQ